MQADYPSTGSSQELSCIPFAQIRVVAAKRRAPEPHPDPHDPWAVAELLLEDPWRLPSRESGQGCPCQRCCYQCTCSPPRCVVDDTELRSVSCLQRPRHPCHMSCRHQDFCPMLAGVPPRSTSHGSRCGGVVRKGASVAMEKQEPPNFSRR